MRKSLAAVNPDAYVAGLSGWRHACVTALRKAIRSVDGLEETIKWRHLVYLSDGPTLLVRAEADRVLLGFWRGQRLTALEPGLQPGGKYEMATMEFREGSAIRPATVRRLVARAKALNGELGDPTLVAGSSRSRSSTQRRGAVLAMMVSVGLTLACGRDTSPATPVVVICGDPLAGLAVYVTDARTGHAIASNTTAIATLSPIYADTTREGTAYSDTSAIFAGYHSGVFRLVVTRAGYSSWSRDAVVVGSAPAPCEGNPIERVRVDVSLEPVP